MSYIDSENTAIQMTDTSVLSMPSVVGQYDFNKAVVNVTPEQKQKYGELVRNVNINNPRTIRSYGQEVDGIVAHQSEEIINHRRANDTTESIKITNELLAEIGYNDKYQSELEHQNGFRGWLKSLPVIGNFIQNVEKSNIKKNTIGHNVNEISKKIESLKIVTMGNNSTLDNMLHNNIAYVKEIRDRIVALMLIKKEVDEKVKNLEMIDNVNLDELVTARDAQRVLSKKITDMQSNETIFKLYVGQIQAMQGTNDVIIDNLDMATGSLIPIMKMQLAFGAVQADQMCATEANKKLREAGNKMLIVQADTLAKTSVEAARQSETPMFDYESIERSTNSFIDAIKNVQGIYANSVSEQEAFQKKLADLSIKYQNALVENRSSEMRYIG